MMPPVSSQHMRGQLRNAAPGAPRIGAVARALPEHYYDQSTLLEHLEREWSERHFNLDRLRRLHENVLVGGRHLALPIECYPKLDSFKKSNDAWIEAAVALGAEALKGAALKAGLELRDIDALYFVSVTGVATPSIDARLMNRVDLSPRLKRVPIFGLGCVAGAAGISRVNDYLRAYPGEVAVLLSVELCSLTLQRRDLSIPNLIASGLFGDGAAAVVVAGADVELAVDDSTGSRPAIVETRSQFYRDTEDVMGWEIGEEGFRVVLSADVPKMVVDNLRADVDSFLGEHGLERSQIATWICHPGGPKVLEAMAEALGVDQSALEPTWRSLREVGNLSSASVLFVLEDILGASAEQRKNGLAMMIAMGPGFCSEQVLLDFGPAAGEQDSGEHGSGGSR